MKTRGMKSLILDLRGNPGGLLDQGVKVADLFLDNRQEIVSTRGRARGSTKEFFDEARQAWPDLPIVVLVNDGTASAAEIIAGALQDHDRAVVVGAPTFGKGLVQTLFPLGEGVALKLTTARWFTPSGRTIQRIAKDEEDQAIQAAQAIVSDTVLGAPDKESTDSALKERPIFHTDAGRVVRGGGGIVPDLVIRPDTLTGAEREFAKALGNGLPQYRDALTTIALEAKKVSSIKSETFKVTPAMRQQVFARLRREGREDHSGSIQRCRGADRRAIGRRDHSLCVWPAGGVPPPRCARSPDANGDGAAAKGTDSEAAAGAGSSEWVRRDGPELARGRKASTFVSPVRPIWPAGLVHLEYVHLKERFGVAATRDDHRGRQDGPGSGPGLEAERLQDRPGVSHSARCHTSLDAAPGQPR